MSSIRMSFGKWKGHLVSTIPPSYLRWLLREVPDLDPAIRRAAEEALRSRGEPMEEPAPRQLPDVRGTIKTWYRRMAMSHHPDRRLDNGAAMSAINAGYELLLELFEVSR